YASWASCEGVSACVVEGGFAESVQEHLGPAIAVDDAALRAELIDAQTFGEQAIASLAQAEGAVTYLTSELGVQPDLLLLGASVGLAPAEEPGDATPVADGSGASPDAAYQAVDALLGTAQEALGGNAN